MSSERRCLEGGNEGDEAVGELNFRILWLIQMTLQQQLGGSLD